jgi:hypothetical protein
VTDEPSDPEEPEAEEFDFDLDLRLDQELLLEAQSRTLDAILQCNRDTLAYLSGYGNTGG